MNGALSASPPASITTARSKSDPQRAEPKKRSQAAVLPPELSHPGVEMLKVSAKSARRVKPRKVWLQLGSAGVDGNAPAEVSICWEKSGRAVGKKQAQIPLSAVREMRFGTSGSPYRTSLHLSPALEPRWLTIIYLVPQSAKALTPTPAFKLVHFIAPSAEVLALWKEVLEQLFSGRAVGGWIAGGSGSAGESSGAEEGRIVKEDEVHRLCARLGMGIGKHEVGLAFRKAAAPRDYLDFRAFQQFVKLLKQRRELDHVFLSLLPPGQHALDLDTWSTFLRDCQQVDLDPARLAKLHDKFADPSTHLVHRDGFASFLMSSDNAPLVDDAGQNMHRPLSEYYISSSHNTYLVGNQFRGESTIEGYIRALQQGCRSVELDVWDGDEHQPVITHGRTLTTKLALVDVLEAINTYAFLASPFPVILSLEIHCDLEQQDVLAQLLVDTLGERLVREQLDGQTGDIDRLPSPWQLRGKVLLKAKNLFLTAAPNAAAVEADESESSSSTSSDSDLKRVLSAVKRSFDDRRPSLLNLGSSSRSPFQSPPTPSPLSSAFSAGVSEPAAPTPSKAPMSRALASLLVYTVGVKARGFNKKETYLPTHVISLGESRLLKMDKDPSLRQDLLSHARTHLVRAYPRGSRLTSTNFLPHQWWACGVQMVALNWQTHDLGMELNSALFARASRTGYVLKPELLRKKGAEKDKETWRKGMRYALELDVIGGHQLPREAGDVSARLDPFVEVSLFAPGSSAVVKRRTRVVGQNAFNPIFSSAFHLNFDAHPSAGMLDLVFLRLEVLNAKGELPPRGSAAADEPFEGKGESVGAFVVGLGSLRPGYRHVPLYDSMGDQHLYSSLFIKSRIHMLGEHSTALPSTAGLLNPGRAVERERSRSRSFWQPRSHSRSRSTSNEGAVGVLG